jgi:hypothetical protein
LRTFFSLRFDIVEAGQSPWASFVAAAEASGAALFVASSVSFGMVLLEATPTAAAESFFFSIFKYD